jgi:hypothetical protein
MTTQEARAKVATILISRLTHEGFLVEDRLISGLANRALKVSKDTIHIGDLRLMGIFTSQAENATQGHVVFEPYSKSLDSRYQVDPVGNTNAKTLVARLHKELPLAQERKTRLQAGVAQDQADASLKASLPQVKMQGLTVAVYNQLVDLTLSDIQPALAAKVLALLQAEGK